MATKYYATPTLFLTTTTHKGTLDYLDVVTNIMRMILMSKEDITAREAMERLDQMSQQEYRDLRQQGEAWMQDIDLQDYMERKNITMGQAGDQLYPIAELLNDQDEEPMTEEELEGSLMEALDEFPMEAFLTWEMPYVEWD